MVWTVNIGDTLRTSLYICSSSIQHIWKFLIEKRKENVRNHLPPFPSHITSFQPVTQCSNLLPRYIPQLYYFFFNSYLDSHRSKRLEGVFVKFCCCVCPTAWSQSPTKPHIDLLNLYQKIVVIDWVHKLYSLAYCLLRFFLLLYC